MSAPAQGRVYWTDAEAARIFFADIQKGDREEISLVRGVPTDLALDPAGGRIWWTSAGAAWFMPSRVEWLALDGSEGYEVPLPPETFPTGFAIDREANPPSLYWTNVPSFGGLPGLLRTEVEYQGAAPTVVDSADRPNYETKLALVPGEAAYYGAGATLVRCGLGADPGPRWFQVPEEVSGLAVDASNGVVYWASARANSIERGDLASFRPERLAAPGATVSRPQGIAVDRLGGFVYWCNATTPAISWATLDGSIGGDLPIAGARQGQPWGIALLLPPSAAEPLIPATCKVGETLRCEPQPCAPDEPGASVWRYVEKVEYQWLREGKPLPGQTGATTEPQQEGSYACEVKYSNAGGKTVLTSNSVFVPQPEASR